MCVLNQLNLYIDNVKINLPFLQFHDKYGINVHWEGMTWKMTRYNCQCSRHLNGWKRLAHVSPKKQFKDRIMSLFIQLLLIIKLRTDMMHNMNKTLRSHIFKYDICGVTIYYSLSDIYWYHAGIYHTVL